MAKYTDENKIGIGDAHLVYFTLPPTEQSKFNKLAEKDGLLEAALLFWSRSTYGQDSDDQEHNYD